MSNRRDRPGPRERRSPDATVANFSDDFMQGLGIPELPEGIPQRLEEALRARIDALLYRLREAQHEQYAKVLEVRLVREAHRAVLTAHELHLREAGIFYATFRHLVEDLGYKSADAGFVRVSETERGAG